MTDYWGAAAAVGRPTQTPSAPAPTPCETHGQYSCNKVDCNCNKSCRLFIRSRGGSFNPLKQDWLGCGRYEWWNGLWLDAPNDPFKFRMNARPSLPVNSCRRQKDDVNSSVSMCCSNVNCYEWMTFITCHHVLSFIYICRYLHTMGHVTYCIRLTVTARYYILSHPSSAARQRICCIITHQINDIVKWGLQWAEQNRLLFGIIWYIAMQNNAGIYLFEYICILKWFVYSISRDQNHLEFKKLESK